MIFPEQSVVFNIFIVTSDTFKIKLNKPGISNRDYIVRFSNYGSYFVIKPGKNFQQSVTSYFLPANDRECRYLSKIKNMHEINFYLIFLDYSVYKSNLN